MIDALHPVLESLEACGEELWQRPGQAMAKAAEAGKSLDHLIAFPFYHQNNSFDLDHNQDVQGKQEQLQPRR